MVASTASAGWPFLVAPGRVRDHTVVVAPAPLVTSGDYGALESVAGGGSAPSKGWEQTAIRRRDGGALAVTYRTRTVTPEDVTGPESGDPPPAVRDEHNRPLVAVVGIVSERPLTGDPGPALEDAWERVLPAYRMFLDDEFGCGVSGSAPMPLRGRPAARPVSEPAVTRTPYAGERSAPVFNRRARATVSRALAVVGLAIVAVLAGLAIALHPWSQPSEQTPAPIPTTKVTTKVTTPVPRPTTSPVSGRTATAQGLASGPDHQDPGRSGRRRP